MSAAFPFMLSELQTAYTRYRLILNLPRNRNTARKFFHFLGIEEEQWNDTFTMDDEISNKLRWITSPHGETLYRVWAAQNPDKADWP